MGERGSEIAALGASLHAVGNGNALMARDFVEQFAVTFPVWTDPGKETYRLAGFRHIVSANLDTFKAGRRAVKAGFRQGKTQGDPWQQGGTLVVSGAGRLWFAHAASFAGDHAAMDDVLRALRSGLAAP